MTTMGRYQVAQYLFGQDAVAASQTDVQLPAPMSEATSVVQGYTMPFDWELIAITAELSAAATAGTLTVGATKGGTEDADTTITITTETSKRKKVRRGKMRGKAGDVLGAEITSGGTWDGTTADLLVTLYVVLDVQGV